MSHPLDEMIATVTRETGWTDEEARLFVSAIKADTPDALMDAVPEAIGWAMRIETAASVVSLMKTLPRGVLDARWTGKEIALRIHPDAQVDKATEGEITITPAPEAGR